MKSAFLKVSIILLSVLLSVTFVSCRDDSTDPNINTEPPQTQPHEHYFVNYESDGNATCEKDGTKTAFCDCGESDTLTDYGSAFGHVFGNYWYDDNQTCTEDGTETAKCEWCGEPDTRTVVGTAGHSFNDYQSDNNATCTYLGTKTAKCDRCEARDTIEIWGEAPGHSFTNYISDNNADFAKDGTKTAKCDRCEERDTIPDEGSAIYSTELEFTHVSGGYSVIGMGSETSEIIYIPPKYNSSPVVSIGANAFENEDITKIVLPDSVESIGESAFSGCAYLESITFSKRLYEIARYAFSACSALKEINIPSSVGKIDIMAFYECIGLESINVDEDSSNFYSSGNCLINTTYRNLVLGCKNSVIPEDKNIVSIDDYAFYGCTGLRSINIPSSIKQIGSRAFEGCSGLEEVHITSITDWCAINFEVFFHYYYIENYYYSNPLYYGCELYLNGELIEDLVIPEGVTQIPAYAFAGQSSIKSVTLPESILSIGTNAFSSCDNILYNEYDNAYYIGNQNNPYMALVKAKDKSIQSCEIKSGTKFICSHAFQRCSVLESITLPDSIISIGEKAFSGCSILSKINFAGTTEQWSKISKGLKWDNYIDYYNIYCTDGKVSMNGTVTPKE